MVDSISASKYSQVVSKLSLEYLLYYFKEDDCNIKKAIVAI